jgi:hypothetical protein
MRTSVFMQSSPPPDYGEAFKIAPDSDLCKKIWQIGESKTDPYQRALVFQLLVNWHVLGSQGPYLQAVAACAQEPGRWLYPTKDVPTMADLQFSQSSPDPAAWRSDSQAMAGMALASKDPYLTAYLVSQIDLPPPADSIKGLAGLLKVDDKQLKYILVTRFHEWLGDPNTAPDDEPVDGLRQCINLDALVNYWKAKFGIKWPARVGFNQHARGPHLMRLFNR